ncbi:MAG: DUF134 domain-containing protein [Limnochordia bacterium]|mgnify:CR=1 FL=1|nr:DUF134 domain-containing protein [Bacillota bacterium]NLL08955.1 DUF134 domain-containing protein [Bacillota bacterium]HBG10334.1 hypothetical protein [Bacillota bacterium]
MPRPRKGRRVCCLPPHSVFGPLHGPPQGEVVMTVDEYESIRLLDLEGLTQEEAAERMEVARTTVQRIYATARQKVAQALYEGAVLRIEGGDYELYSADQEAYGCGRCRRKRRGFGRRHGM